MTIPSDMFSIIWISIVAYSMVQGYLLFLIFPTYRDGSKQAKWLLACLSLLCGILQTEELLEETVGYESFPHLIFAFSPFWYRLAPLLFLYIRLYTKNRGVTWKDVVHLIPACFMIYQTLNFYGASGAFKLEYMRNFAEGNTHPVHNINYIIYCAQSCFYLVMSWILLRRSQMATAQRQQNRWLLQLIIGLAVMTSLSFLSWFSINGGTWIISWLGPVYVIWVTTFLILLFLKTVKTPKVLYFLSRIGDWRINSNQAFTEESLQSLLQYMSEYQPQKDPYFDIQTLARQMGYSKNYLNRLIKKCTGLSFRDFINQYRLEDAKQMLNSPHSKQYTIQSIAGDSGFSSLATFYRVFKKMEGTTPKTFIGGNKEHQAPLVRISSKMG
ncbi:MAG: helix-turn-helix domain-containing protein [Bacteroidetes bacterium]|nr:helix-turn-helix domain-containing protein [Bacteroidota bacterium]